MGSRRIRLGLLALLPLLSVIVSVSAGAFAVPREHMPLQKGSKALPRTVRISGRRFVDAATGAPMTLRGPNVVVKGPPYLPEVSGTSVCKDRVDGACEKSGDCASCETFNQADADHLKFLGWNFIRLGVVWAGGQPDKTRVDELDSAFLERLHAVLNLTDRNGLHVMLDLHGDMTGSAGCGNGVPIWFQELAAPHLIGKPLETDFPYSLFVDVANVPGYSVCGAENATAWAEHAGDPLYNLLNRCCQAMNSPNPGGLGFTTVSQATIDYMITPGPGRDAFVRYWRLLAEAVAQHPSAFAAELFNEPMSINRRLMYDTWRAAQGAINSVIPDMSVSVADTGEGAIVPYWVDKLLTPDIDISATTVKWLRETNTIFYAWHWYGFPSSIKEAIENVQALMLDWNMPSFATEFTDCAVWNATAELGISHSYWHYSSYCTTGPAFGNRKVPQDTFGACILGWAGGDASKCT
jgi:Cellulase (glycosyl hydrolase family 5)